MGGLKNSLIKGVYYTSIAKYAGLVISIFITSILARILTPSDFGVVAISTVFINFFSTLTTIGISPAIIQNKSIENNDLCSINTFTWVISFVITGLYILFVPIISDFYEEKELNTILLLLSINIFFSIVAIVPNAMLLKEKRFKFIAVRTFVIQFVLGVISVVAAYNGLGIYSLVINPIGSSLLLFVTSYKAYPVKWNRIQRQSIKKILSFSLYQMVFNCIYLCYRNVDKMLIGKFWNVSILGYYEKSYRLMMLPLENVSSVISPVLHPLLSDYQNNPQYLWEVYKKMLSFLCEFSFIVSVSLYFLADFIILALYGIQWEAAIPIFKILSLSICFQLLQAPIGAILQAANAVNILVYSSIWILLLMIGGLGIAVFFQDFGIVPISVDIVFAMGFIIYQLYVAKIFRQKNKEIFDLMRPHLIYAIILLLILLFIDFAININVFIKGGIFIFIILVYFASLCLMNRLPYINKLLKDAIRKITMKK